ncbi:Retrovirus-related Pol polyprotein from transposon TNT 1-94 [Dendrobium catenatum]|uniref:Retrovirus-related Pol polyprotein from transposon TNT 1-94 n=1 Tax=Dendrobium catenatum TaxID=906689 RepID=A0A2I0VU42_9ASPA|nr:Retrovirus-related Pol polyprotein from transposon TNT 1-94 [Dendrobium catenatum]
MANSATSGNNERSSTEDKEEPQISSSLKFLVANIKNIAPIHLTTDNYAIWKPQILKIFSAQGFHRFLDSSVMPPDKSPSQENGSSIPIPSSAQWYLTDHILSAALCSTITAPILPYIINLESTAAIWAVLETRFQSSNRSKVTQLKNTLHNFSLKNLTMHQYLAENKAIVDQIAVAGSVVDTEDIILYILNGLPNLYQPFKTAIQTMLHPISLDQLYPLLLSEEINLASDASHNNTAPDPAIALSATRGNYRKNRNRQNYSAPRTARNPANQYIIYQICLKKGHSAQDCWHRMNSQYVPATVNNSSKALVANPESVYNNWLLDSGATSHLTNSMENMSISNSYQGTDNITVGDGQTVKIAHTGAGLLPTPSRKLTLNQLFHTPDLHYNLLSISRLIKDNNVSILFNPHSFVLKDLQTKKILLQGPCLNGLYQVPTTRSTDRHQALSAIAPKPNLWHSRLSHPHNRILHTIANNNPHLSISSLSSNCMSCKSSKGHKLSFDKSATRHVSLLSLIHSDVWGPAPVVSIQGFRYYVIFVDDYSRFTWIFPLKQKSEVTDVFINFKKKIETYTSHTIKSLRTDGGMEFMNKSFQQFLIKHGITHQVSCPYTPEQNGVSERKHRHIIETTRTLLHAASIPYYHWPDAALTSVYLINRMPSSVTFNTSPFELFHHVKPDYGHLRVFGCACFPLAPSHTRHKLQPKANINVFLGYSDTYKGYKCLDRLTNRIFISRNISFDESYFPFAHSSSVPSQHMEPPPPGLLIPVSAPSTKVYGKQDLQASRPPPQLTSADPNQPATSSSEPDTSNLPNDVRLEQQHHHMITRKQTGSLKPRVRLNLCHTSNINSLLAPSNFTEASKTIEWRQAMAMEFYALQKQGTWSLVSPPSNVPVLGSKWTYRLKLHSDGSIAKHKARLVALGNQQEYGIDYTETFSPVAKLPTIRILLTIALYNEWKVQQLDVANAFLHGNLSEKVYMHQPKGFEDKLYPNHVCCLHKAIYGLKQAPRQWYNTFTSHLVSLGFTHSNADPSLLVFKHNDIQIYLLMYVDDILITGNNPTLISDIISKLSVQLTMKHLGEASDFLGIRINLHSNGYFLSQYNYAYKILQQVHLTECKPLANPACTKAPANLAPDPVIHDPGIYKKITGSLQYLTITRPDIAHSVNQLSQHMHNPLTLHFYLLKRLLRYIKGTLSYGLPISKSNLNLTSFSDADWAGDPLSRRSTSGYCSFLGTTLINWTVRKQHTVARSSMESEYRALASLTADVLWLRRLLQDFGISQQAPTTMYCDKTSAIALANNPVFHARTNHIEIDQKFIREHIQNNTVRLLPISTTDQVADIFTKSLSTPRFQQLRNKLTVTTDPSVCRGV